MKFNNILLLMLLLVGMSSCKLRELEQKPLAEKIPKQYNSISLDTSAHNIAQINWKNYYNDSLLIHLIDTAIVRNFDLQMTISRIEMARANVQFAKGNLLPKIDASVSVGSTKYAKYTQEYAGNVTTIYDGNKIVPNPLDNYYLGLSSNWEIDIWRKLNNQKKASIATYLASVEGKNFVISNLVSNVAESYYELIALDKELEIVEQTIEKRKEALSVIKLQKETGRSNELAVQQFEAQLLDLQAFQKDLAQRIVEMENSINFLLGRYPTPIKRNTNALNTEMPNEISAGIPAELLLHRADIREAEQELVSSKFDVRAAKMSFMPSLNIGTTLGYQSFDPQFFLSTPASIGYSALGGLMAPVINRNAIRRQYEAAKANQKVAFNNYQKKLLYAYVEVSRELSLLENLKDIQSYKQQQSAVLEKSVLTSSELYKNAKANYLEVLLAQENSLKARLELIEIQKRQKISIVHIYKALGGGW